MVLDQHQGDGGLWATWHGHGRRGETWYLVRWECHGTKHPESVYWVESDCYVPITDDEVLATAVVR